MNLAGHDEPRRQWHAALAGPRLHHAWILAGRRGTGKATFALQAARELVAETGTVLPGGNHPDVIALGPLPATPDDEKKRDEGKPHQVKRNITVDQIRGMQRRLTTRPTLGARRAIVIDPADDLEKSAANALLKSLEEPPAGTFFFLIAHRPGRLLPTIRSRCRLLQFPRVEAAQRALLRAAGGPVKAPYLRDDLRVTLVAFLGTVAAIPLGVLGAFGCAFSLLLG